MRGGVSLLLSTGNGKFVCGRLSEACTALYGSDTRVVVSNLTCITDIMSSFIVCSCFSV